jgi:hypothetical protein
VPQSPEVITQDAVTRKVGPWSVPGGSSVIHPDAVFTSNGYFDVSRGGYAFAPAIDRVVSVPDEVSGSITLPMDGGVDNQGTTTVPRAKVTLPRSDVLVHTDPTVTSVPGTQYSVPDSVVFSDPELTPGTTTSFGDQGLTMHQPLVGGSGTSRAHDRVSLTIPNVHQWQHTSPVPVELPAVDLTTFGYSANQPVEVPNTHQVPVPHTFSVSTVPRSQAPVIEATQPDYKLFNLRIPGDGKQNQQVGEVGGTPPAAVPLDLVVVAPQVQTTKTTQQATKTQQTTKTVQKTQKTQQTGHKGLRGA